jgi:hypothetical protein
LSTHSNQAGGQEPKGLANSGAFSAGFAHGHADVHATAADVVRSTPISTVFAWLGGDPPKRGRARAFWRDGDNQQAVSLSDAKAAWFDHRDNVGGGVIDLVQHVRGGSRQDALRWLASMTGIAIDDQPLKRHDRTDWWNEQRIKREAFYFASAAWVLAEDALEALEPWDPQRAVYTSLLRATGICPLAEYRKWRERSPDMAAALVHAGKRRQKRLQTMLAHFLSAEAHAA